MLLRDGGFGPYQRLLGPTYGYRGYRALLGDLKWGGTSSLRAVTPDRGFGASGVFSIKGSLLYVCPGRRLWIPTQIAEEHPFELNQ